MIGRTVNFLLALAHHWLARLRRRFITKDKNYVVRPWTVEEEKDFQQFVKDIGKIPEDPVHARLMEDGPIDFFTVDPWYDMELPRA